MPGKWTRIIEQAGDENIGAALIRLAKAAGGVHMFEAARSVKSEGAVGGTGGTPTLTRRLRPTDAAEGRL